MKNRIVFVICCLFTAGLCVAQNQTPANSSYRQEGIASWYGAEYEGRPTASGEFFDPNQFTAAHPDLPFGTLLIITNALNGEQVLVRVNDRGPFVKTRIVDVSRAAAEKLNMLETGTAQVIVELAPRNASAMNMADAESAQVSQPAVTAQSFPAEQPAPANQAAQVSQPAATAQSFPVEQPAQTNQSPQANQPAQVVQPGLTAQTVPAGQPAQTNQPPQTSQPAVTAGSAPGAPQPVSAPAARSTSSGVAAQPRSSTARTPPVVPSYTPQQPALTRNPASPQAESARSAPQNRTQPVTAPVASFQPVPTIARPPAAAPSPAPTMPSSAQVSALSPMSNTAQTQPPRAYPSYAAAEISGGPFVSGRYYRLQIGSFRVAKNAVEVFDRLSAAGLNPQWEPFGELYRVVISNVRSDEVNSIAVKLGNAGFKEAIAREER